MGLSCILKLSFTLESGNWVQMNVWKDGSAAWPVANPVLTCASVSDAGFPSNFVADPFLYIKVVILSLILDFPL